MSTTQDTHNVLGVYRRTDSGVQLTKVISNYTLYDTASKQIKNTEMESTDHDERFSDLDTLKATLIDNFQNENDPANNSFLLIELRAIAEGDQQVLAPTVQDTDPVRGGGATAGEGSTQAARESSLYGYLTTWFAARQGDSGDS